MAYDSTIPALGNLISNDIPAMQENFSLLESAQVVDEGSTSDGYYIRYENGWQVCTQKKDDGNQDIDDLTNGLYRSSTFEQEYPNSFSETPVGGALGNDGSGGFLVEGFTEDNNWLYRYISIQELTDRNTFGNIRLFAIGRWK